MAPSYDAHTSADELVPVFASEIKGKVVLTTGVSPGGLGAFFVEQIAKADPALLILAGRSLTKIQQEADALKGVKTRLLQLDLGSLAAVREAAATVNAWDDVPAIDVLVNNAGIMGTNYKLTPDGFESQFGTNHLGHFLFTNLIMKKLLSSKSPRVVSVSSDGHRLSPIRWGDPNYKEPELYNPWTAYGQSKTANILFAVSLAQKLGKSGLQAYSLHPGVINTHLGDHVNWETELPGFNRADKLMGNEEGWADFKWKTNEQGVATHVFAAFSPSLKDHNGAYLQDSHIADPWTETVKPWATDKTEAERLWKLSEKLVGQEFSY